MDKTHVSNGVSHWIPVELDDNKTALRRNSGVGLGHPNIQNPGDGFIQNPDDGPYKIEEETSDKDNDEPGEKDQLQTPEKTKDLQTKMDPYPESDDDL
eukprot:CAMPEP_0185257902 /NCGR_PEP_ID=MMETSP1359-20130426/6912_1 /TAXON_ID=552665 /ORGANISM="Bigelowiella longifila, Strain CCMP242" /LENGTH=97 /DNA_ID=CAMNT_0027843191 /DNA_START=167 /DNA_END=460 /DNA_ORIENTATION=+